MIIYLFRRILLVLVHWDLSNHHFIGLVQYYNGFIGTMAPGLGQSGVCSMNEAREWFDDGGKGEVFVNYMYFPPCLIAEVPHGPEAAMVCRETVYSHL